MNPEFQAPSIVGVGWVKVRKYIYNYFEPFFQVFCKKKIEKIFFSKKQKNRFHYSPSGTLIQNFKSLVLLVWAG